MGAALPPLGRPGTAAGDSIQELGDRRLSSPGPSVSTSATSQQPQDGRREPTANPASLPPRVRAWQARASKPPSRRPDPPPPLSEPPLLQGCWPRRRPASWEPEDRGRQASAPCAHHQAPEGSCLTSAVTIKCPPSLLR